MRPSDDLSELAREMQARRQGEGGAPFILFLGQELAAAAGVPSLYQIAHDIFTDPDLKMLYLRDEDLSDRVAVLAAFDEFLGTLTTGQRYRMLQNFYSSIALPTFYQDLVLLVKAGFFDHILTTNIDNLFEQALTSAGLTADRDYRTLTLGQGDEALWKRPSSASDSVPISVIKLHGDLFQRRAAITRDEIDRALRPQRFFIKGEISGDMIMVGYQLESEPLNEWLAWVPGDLWWVGPDPLDETLLRRVENTRPVRRISGDSARPQVFFEQLAWLLLRSPAQNSLTIALNAALYELKSLESADDQPRERDVISEGIPVTGAGEPARGEIPAATEISDAAYLETQLQRNRAVLLALKQSQTPGEKDPQLELQIEYQRQQIVELEAQLRDMQPNRERLLDLLKTVRRSVNDAARMERIDPNAAAFMRKQVSTVQGEYRRETPNQSIVAAAIGATVVLAERLETGVVDPSVIQQLAAYAPSAVGGRL